MKVFGTTTSPYTRKIRILAGAIGLPVELCDTRTDEGAGALAAVAPLGKIPVMITDGHTIPDSGLIAQWLWAHHGPALAAAGFDLASDAWAERSLHVVVEGALDAAINRFYLRRDNFPDRAYVTRQRDRVETALRFLDTRIMFARPLGPARLSLGCALDWMVFREAADLSRHPGLVSFREAWTESGIGAGTEPG